MPEETRTPAGVDENGKFTFTSCPPEKKFWHYRRVTGVLMRDAMNAWSDIWEQLRDNVTPGGQVTSEMTNGFVPSCGWPEFLEKMWLLKHYIDYTKRFAEGRA